MPSSSRYRALGVAVALAVSAHASRGEAQQAAQGFAVERLYPSAPGGGWFVMDTLDLDGGLGGAMALTFGYARNPLRVSQGAQRLSVVSDEALVDLGAALTYGRWRFYLDLATPLLVQGESGTVGGYTFIGPSLTTGQNPDTISDARLGVDVRIFGRPGGAFRLGAGAQLIVPSGDRKDYDTDGTFRGMIRVLFAGDASHFVYAGHLGVHIRPLDDGPAPGSPQGHEMLFGFAAGVKLPMGRKESWATVIGPEVWGATPFRSFFRDGTTAVEALLSSRFEGPIADGFSLRIKLGAGIGSSEQFGAPSFRVIGGVEMFHTASRP